MNVLTPLQEIEEAHHKLLKTLSDSPANQESEDQQCPSATVSRTPSLDRGSINSERESEFNAFTRPSKFSNVFVSVHTGREAGPAEPKIQSTGF